MAVCAFLGHDTCYDKKLGVHLSEAIKNVIFREDDENVVEFVISDYGAHKPVFKLYLQLLLETMQHHFQKQICISIAVQADEREKAITQLMKNEFFLPTCFVDKVISPPMTQSISKDLVIRHKQLERWIIQNADYLISYLYLPACAVEYQLYRYAQKRNVCVLDVTDESTKDEIIKSIGFLSPKDQFIIREICAGKKLRDISEKLGVTPSYVQQEGRLAYRRLRTQLQNQPYLRNGTMPLLEKSCSVLELGEVTYQSMAAFLCGIRFLMRIYDVTHIRVTEDVYLSGYMAALKVTMLDREFEKVCITVETNENSPQAKLYEQRLRTAQSMIGKSDFCICDLSHSTLADSLKSYMCKNSRIMILDIGKNNFAI